MKIKSDLKLRMIAGETIVLLKGERGRDMIRVLALNPTSLFLWEKLKDREFELDDAVSLLCDNYEVDLQTARADVGKWVDQLKEFKVLE